jgi:RimJ/RimL family protein N-acetyltransferase
MSLYKSFETERLILQPTNEDDADFIMELLNTPKWLSFIGDRNVHTPDEARVYIRNRILKQFGALGYGNYTVIRKEDHRKIGSCGLYKRDGLDSADIGFAFLPEYEGKGYGYEAASKILTEAVDSFGLDHIQGITVRENAASRKLLEKLGLSYTKMITLPGNTEEIMLYEAYLTRQG